MENTSDEKICSIICGSKCCRSTPPALTKEDFSRIQANTKQENWFKTINEKNNIRVVGKKGNLVDCYFLSEKGLCRIYENRPLDCKLFPLFVKIKPEGEKEYRLRWYVWYCPLTEKKGIEELLQKAEAIVHDYLLAKPEIMFDYQNVMYVSGGYKKKHFLKEELLTIKSND
ncbi:MAG: YkgJ family cysteine cluster protein [Candidatus Heimdallarchaeota archaeon]|nr:YkgJ family cysteine cluster protein [Candidatus Heimdallarchaeota archaeon]